MQYFENGANVREFNVTMNQVEKTCKSTSLRYENEAKMFE